MYTKCPQCMHVFQPSMIKIQDWYSHYIEPYELECPNCKTKLINPTREDIQKNYKECSRKQLEINPSSIFKGVLVCTAIILLVVSMFLIHPGTYLAYVTVFILLIGFLKLANVVLGVYKINPLSLKKKNESGT